MCADIDGVQTLCECAEFNGNIVAVFPRLGNFLCPATPIPSGCGGCTTTEGCGSETSHNDGGGAVGFCAIEARLLEGSEVGCHGCAVEQAAGDIAVFDTGFDCIQ